MLAAACGSRVPDRVDPRDHDQFWLWAGVAPSPALDRASMIYILDSEVRGPGAVRVPLRPAIPHVDHAAVWMVVRTDRLPWPEASRAAVLRQLDSWSAAGNRIEGLQVDFDARTRVLADYAAFLAELREALPEKYKLSITGLMDWSANGDPKALAALKGSVDEVIIQTYQGRSTIFGYELYFERMRGFPLPFKVGLVEGGQWIEPAGLAREPNYRGTVVFLLPR